MKASELIATLQTDIDTHGDFDVRFESTNAFGDTVVLEIQAIGPFVRSLLVRSSVAQSAQAQE